MREVYFEKTVHDKKDYMKFSTIKEKFTFNEKKDNHRIVFPNGVEYTQKTSFGWHTADWNNDGDVYEQFGAAFVCTKPLLDSFNVKNHEGNKEFWTLEDLVELIVEGAIMNNVIRRQV